jgi:hypothetical protein
MACDFSALDQIDTSDPEQANALLQQCTAALLSPDLWAWAIGLTIVGAVVGALIGRKKNTIVRDALLGAALGPIGWIISAKSPARVPEKKCRACGVIVAPTDAFCRSCGTALTPSPAGGRGRG